jgi:beta-lactamase class A
MSHGWQSQGNWRWTRRTMLAALLSAAASGCAASVTRREADLAARLAALQSRYGGRLGVYVLDTGSRRAFGLNEQDRFAMCSTFKLLLAAAILAKADTGKIDLEHRVRFGPQDMLPHAPVTSAWLEAGAMNVRQLCAAAVEASDNPAANLLLALIGGPTGLTEFLRGIGDPVTRLDRTELALNTNIAGDPRDTTTPHAMVETVQRLLTGSVLATPSRDLLIRWLVNSSTGLQRVRAGLPQDWKVGDKTGTGTNGAVNDVAIAWPPGRAPLIAAVYMSESKLPTKELEQAHAQIGRLVAQS